MAQLMQPQLPSVVPEKQVAFAEIECQPSQTPPETLEMFKPDAVLRSGDFLIGISNSVSVSVKLCDSGCERTSFVCFTDLFASDPSGCGRSGIWVSYYQPE